MLLGALVQVLIREVHTLVEVSWVRIIVSCAVIVQFRFIPRVGCSSEGLHGTSASLLTVIKV